jgi:cell division protein FtsB
MKLAKTIILVFILVYFSSSLVRGIWRNMSVLTDYHNLLTDLEKEKERNQELKLKITRLNNDDYLELLARKKLGMVKKGEIVYKVVSNN